MMEYVGKSSDEIASWFVTSTCQLLPKTSPVVSDRMHALILSDETVPKEYSIMCGSAAEFYIRPLNACVTDNDFFISSTDRLAFSGDLPVLPSDRSGLADAIECYKIEPYHRYPGFVRLRVLGEINFNWKHKKYEFNQTARTNGHIKLNMAGLATAYTSEPIVKSNPLPNSVSGPAIKFRSNRFHTCVACDLVTSVWCPQWPREAQAWRIRPRKYRWPTIDTISEVLHNGCHVVYVQHRSCRDDTLQWRLSFSIAEIILLQSWTKIQQIVYHMLRFFSKRELIRKDCPKEDEVLCTYHLKTLMLWTCEEMSPEWWDSSSVISICCELLQKLSEWLKRRHCPNYFISDANLFHETPSPTILDKTERHLNKFCNSDILCHWFVENYISSFIRTHESERNVMPDLVYYALTLLEVWKMCKSRTLDLLFSVSFTNSYGTCRSVFKYGLRSGLCQFSSGRYREEYVVADTNIRMTFYPTIENVLCFTYSDNLLYLLHTAYGLANGEISWNNGPFVDFVKAISMQPKIVRSQFHNFPKTYTALGDQFAFIRAQDLMKNLTGSNSRSEFQLHSLMSKQFLRKALEYDNSKPNGIAPAALAYLAALHFATSEYQQAIHLCLAVLVDQTSQKDKETLNAGCLLFIDDVARIVGLYVLYKKITNNLRYTGRQLYLDLRLSPEVFAYYLTVFSAERKSNNFNFNHDLPDAAFPMDEYLKALIKAKCIVSIKSGSLLGAARQIVYRRTDLIAEAESAMVNSLIITNTVIHILMEYALENMISFYSVLHKDFGIQCNIVDCYRALYLYKRRQYDEVFHLCERILHEPDVQSNLKTFAFANVLVVPPLDSFFDGDVQSLLGLHTLFYYLSPLNDEMRKFKITDESTFAHFFAQRVWFLGNELSESLPDRYSTRCNYFLKRHFVARYLKVRCCIDCDLPYKEAMTEFAAHKSNLPFGHIIHRFLLQKLRANNN